MNKNNMMKYALIAGGAYLAYWWVTNYGPSGPVSDQSGNPIPGAVSYWASWFGGAATGAVTASSTSTSTALPPNTTTTTTNTGTGSGSGSTSTTGTSSTQQMATTQQLQAINNLLSPSDQRTFLGMANNLTAAQATAMLANAQACASGQTYSPGSGLCYAPKAAPTDKTISGASGGSAASRSHSGVNGMGQIMPLSPFITPATNGVRNPETISNTAAGMGMGDIVPMASGATTGLGSLSRAIKSPWGKLGTTIN